MIPVSPRSALAIGLSLALLMAATRSHHFATALHLPDASWAVFFLAGVYLRPVSMLPALMAEAALIDYAAVTWGGVSSFCIIPPAYAFLVPAYSALWLAGRWYAGRYLLALSTLIPLAGSVLVGAAVCELFSSGGFYLFSGYFKPTFTDFGIRLAKYFPLSLAAMMFYVMLAVIVHAALGAVLRGGRRAGERQAL
jgi:hypothetical protein